MRKEKAQPLEEAGQQSKLVKVHLFRCRANLFQACRWTSLLELKELF